MGRRRTVLDRFFRDRDGRLVLGQRPNLPIIVWAVAWILRWPLNGQAEHVAWLVGLAALLLWAVLELGWGVTYFRRALGLMVLTYVIIHLLV